MGLAFHGRLARDFASVVKIHCADLLSRWPNPVLLLQGVTGFGSSIALLSTWVVSRAVGIRACEFLETFAVHIEHG